MAFQNHARYKIFHLILRCFSSAGLRPLKSRLNPCLTQSSAERRYNGASDEGGMVMAAYCSSFHRIAASLFFGLLALLLIACALAHAQAQWTPGWLPCSLSGTPLWPGQGYSGFPVAMGGPITASGSEYDWWGSSSTPGGTWLYDPLFSGDPISYVASDSYNGLSYAASDDGTPIMGQGSVTATSSLQVCFLWNPSFPPGLPPPPTASFLVQTQLTVLYDFYYRPVSGAPAGGSVVSLSAAASITDNYGEQLQVDEPSGHYPTATA
jgi:hypothetical protein